MRDLTLSGRLPPLKQLTYVTSGIVYPIGGQIHRWLADTYGDWRVALMYKELNRHESFEAAIQAVYGRTLDQLSDEFQLAMRRQFYPSVDSLAPLAVLGTRGRPAGASSRRSCPTRADTATVAGEVVVRVAGQRVRLDLPEVARRAAKAARDRDRRPHGRDRVVPSLRFPHGRVPPGPAALHRPLRRPRRADRLGPQATARSRAGTSSPSWSRCSRPTGCPTARASW